MLSRLNSAFSRLLIRPVQAYQPIQYLHITQINEAARKGTREKARKKKLKNELKKASAPSKRRFIVRKQTITIDDSWKAIPTDNVYPGRYFRWRLYSIEEAIKSHLETHHPTMYDVPDARVNVSIELNMKGEKKTKPVSPFTKMAMIDYPFDHKQERNILVFAKDPEQAKEALDAGALTAGSSDVIRSIQKGDIRLSDYEFVLAHPNIMPDLVALRGLLKRKFPNPKTETLGVNVGEMVNRFINGLSYKVILDNRQPDFGTIKTSIGNLEMPVEHLKANLLKILTSINTARPKRDGTFVSRVIMTCLPSQEKFKIDPKDFPFEYELKTNKDEDDDDDDDADETKLATN